MTGQIENLFRKRVYLNKYSAKRGIDARLRGHDRDSYGELCEVVNSHVGRNPFLLASSIIKFQKD